MKVTFITNYMTHHQLPFALSMYKRLGDDFTFIETNSMDDERKGMGWELDKDVYPFIHSFENSIYDSIIEEGEVVILGGTHQVYLGKRLQNKKLTFRYFERLYKTGQYKAYIPSSYRRMRAEHTKRNDLPIYLLCAGAYVASDFSLFGAYPDKMFKWGYFPAFEELDIDSVIANKDAKNILWCGRMIDWKQPLMPLVMAKKLKVSGVEFQLTMIGEGPYRDKVMNYINKYNLNDVVKVCDYVKPDDVRNYMKRASIYLMTSNMEEGWGAVVNEAMNSGCAVIGSYGAGCVPYLIEDNVNGIVYDYKDVGELSSYVIDLLNDSDKRTAMGKAAYKTIKDSWNSEAAAERFIELCNNLLNNNVIYEEEGPLSKAHILKPRDGYKQCKRGDYN